MNEKTYELAKGLSNSNVAEVAEIAKGYVEMYEILNEPYDYELAETENLNYDTGI